MSTAREMPESHGILYMFLSTGIRVRSHQEKMCRFVNLSHRWHIDYSRVRTLQRTLALIHNCHKYLVDVDECVETRNICENGRCINTEGGVICECPVGYQLSDKPNSMRCIDLREELCYDTYRRGQCTSPREGGMTRKHCCCTMGKAWGRHCEPCPQENSGNETQNLPKI